MVDFDKFSIASVLHDVNRNLIFDFSKYDSKRKLLLIDLLPDTVSTRVHCPMFSISIVILS